MPDQNQTARSIAENVLLRAAHQIFTVVGLPAVLMLSGWTLKTTVEANERLAVVETLKPRIERLERMADRRGPLYPLDAGLALEREVQRLDGRVVALERHRERHP